MKKTLQVLILSSSLALLGCGGGNGNSDPTQSTGTQTGTTDPTTGTGTSTGTTDPTTGTGTPTGTSDPTTGTGTSTGTTDPTTGTGTSTGTSDPTTGTGTSTGTTDPTTGGGTTDPTSGDGNTGAASTEDNNLIISSNIENRTQENDASMDDMAIMAKKIDDEQEAEKNNQSQLNSEKTQEPPLSQEIKDFTPVAQQYMPPKENEEYLKDQQKQQEEWMKAQQQMQEQQERQFNLLSKVTVKEFNDKGLKKENLNLKELPLEAIPCDNAVMGNYVDEKNNDYNINQLFNFKDFSKINYHGWFFVSAQTVLTDNPADDHTIFFDNELMLARYLSQDEIVLEPTHQLFENNLVVFKNMTYPVVQLSAIRLVPMLNDIDYDCKTKVYKPQMASIKY